jgi:radical SAM protein with 4Fe4S-binding SPASM domain
LTKIIYQLRYLSIIKENSNRNYNNEFNSKLILFNDCKPYLSAPETVHWAITYQCNSNCPDCYTKRFVFPKNELNTEESKKVIHKIARSGVFQLAFGGGEPLLRKDLPELSHFASDNGLSVHITTGKKLFSDNLLRQLSGAVTTLSLGLSPYFFLPSKSSFYPFFKNKITLAVEAIKKAAITPTANLFLIKSIIPTLGSIIKKIADFGFSQVTLLRYKPFGNPAEFKRQNPDSIQLVKLHSLLTSIIGNILSIKLRIDCSFSFLQRFIPPTIAIKLGIKGCTAADRILAIIPDGSIFPCSQLIHPECLGGNLLENDLETLWENSENLQKYRFYKNQDHFKKSKCGVRQVQVACGGCHIFKDETILGDPGCPGPIISTLHKKSITREKEKANENN